MPIRLPHSRDGGWPVAHMQDYEPATGGAPAALSHRHLLPHVAMARPCSGYSEALAHGRSLVTAAISSIRTVDQPPVSCATWAVVPIPEPTVSSRPLSWQPEIGRAHV